MVLANAILNRVPMHDNAIHVANNAAPINAAIAGSEPEAKRVNQFTLSRYIADAAMLARAPTASTLPKR